MCHLLSRETLLFTGNRFITKKHLKLKVPDSPGENGTFSQNSVLQEMCHLSSRTTLLLTENRFITKKPLKSKVPDSPARTALFSKKLDSLFPAEKIRSQGFAQKSGTPKLENKSTTFEI